jgi:hypothetical protein
VLPATVLLKLRLVTDSVTGALPVPDKLTVWGEMTALSAIVKVPAAAPTATGEKVTPTVQVFPAWMLAPQVLLATVNGPLAPMLVKLSAPAWLLVSVTDLAALVLPATCELKLRLVTESVTGAMPVPERFTV